jgi:hypothetical protein
MMPQINCEAVAVMFDAGGAALNLQAGNLPVDDNNQVPIDDNAKAPID